MPRRSRNSSEPAPSTAPTESTGFGYRHSEGSREPLRMRMNSLVNNSTGLRPSTDFPACEAMRV